MSDPAVEPVGRRRPPIIPILVLVALVAGLAFLLLFRSRPEEAVRRLIDAQIKLAQAGPARSEDLHQTLSAQAKEACPLESFQGALSAVPADFWQLIEYRDVDIEIDGDRAVVTYVITYNGRPVERATAEDPDLYVRATETVLGPREDVAEELAALERQQQPGPVANPLPPEEYQRQREAIIQRGETRPVLYEAGEWYDDLDGHVRCS